jgi:hypothetical protein
MSISILDDPDHWRERAEDARDVAEQLSDPVSRDMMLRIAESCDRLAELAEYRGECTRGNIPDGRDCPSGPSGATPHNVHKGPRSPVAFQPATTSDWGAPSRAAAGRMLSAFRRLRSERTLRRS